MIKQYATFIALGLVSSIGIAAWFYYQGLLLTISKLEVENFELESAINKVTTFYESEVNKVQDEISKQNDKVRLLEQEGNVLTSKLQDALITAQTTKTIYQTEITKILEAKAPETCDEAIQYLIESKEQLKWDEF